jgi:hypothetical protein
MVIKEETMDAERMARLERLLDRQEIIECLNAFSRGMDRFDREIYLSAFHPDAEMAVGPFVGGVADCYDWAMPMHEAGQKATHHNLLNINIEFDGDTAHTETYYLFVARNRDDSNWIAGGRYIDRFEKRGGKWKIALRTNSIEWSGIVPTMALPFSDVPDIYGNGAPARSTEDPSYQRPLVNRRSKNNPGG